MNRNSRKPDVNTDNGTAAFLINMNGDVHNHSYLGRFVVKCVLSPIDTIEADKAYREMLGDNIIMASEQAKDYAFALAQLKYRVMEYPPFWQTDRVLGNLDDTNVTIAVLNLAIDSEIAYKKAKEQERKDIEKSLTSKIKNNQIEKELEVESIQDKMDKQEEEIDLGE